VNFHVKDQGQEMFASKRLWAVLAGASVGWMISSLSAYLLGWLAYWVLWLQGYGEQQAFSWVVGSIPFLFVFHLFGFTGMIVAGYLVTALDPLRKKSLPFTAGFAIALITLVISITPFPSPYPGWSTASAILLPLLGAPLGGLLFRRTHREPGTVSDNSARGNFQAETRGESAVFLLVVNALGLLIFVLMMATFFFLCLRNDCQSEILEPDQTFVVLLLAGLHVGVTWFAVRASFLRLSHRWIVPGLMMASAVAALEMLAFVAGVLWIGGVLDHETAVTGLGLLVVVGFALIPLASASNAVALARCIRLEKSVGASASV
jgi:hypothetical protein